MRYLSDALTVAVGAVLMAYAGYATLKTLLDLASPTTVVLGNSGDLGALFTMGLFGLGAFSVAYGLFSGLHPGVRQD